MPVIAELLKEMTVFPFELYDITIDDYRRSTRFGTPDAIKGLGGRRVEGFVPQTVPASTIHDGLTEKGAVPFIPL